MLQLVPKASARPALGLVQVELVLLMQATIPELPSVFPASEGTAHAAPPAGATSDESLAWYAVQQSLLCCIQVCSGSVGWARLATDTWFTQAVPGQNINVGEPVQALSDLLALPAAISQHLQHDLGKFNGTQAIGLLQPGHCIWHVKRLSKVMPQLPLETLENEAPLASVEYAPFVRSLYLKYAVLLNLQCSACHRPTHSIPSTAQFEYPSFC